MKKDYAADVRLSQLSLVDGPATAGDAPAADTPSSTGQGTNDVAKASADKNPAPAASHARATALGAAKRDQGGGRPDGRGPATRNGADARAEGQDRDETPGKDAGRGRQSRASLSRKQVFLIGGVLGSVVVVAAIVAMLSLRGPAPAQNVSAPAAPAAKPVPSTPPSAATSVAAETGTLRKDISSEEFASKLQTLKAAGNWNVLVLYAAEWTRKQPANGEAWRELSLGYVKMRQFVDALDAATKAVQFAPSDFLGWQNLGQVNLTLQQPAAALVAFDRAVAINEQDVVSLVQVGLLNAQLGHFPEARNAFAKALAVNPENVPALCGAASVAQKEGHLQDAEAMARQLKSIDGHCADPSSTQSVHVLAGSPAKNKADSPAYR